MLVTVFVSKAITTGIVRRIYICAFYLCAVASLQQIQCVKIVAVNQQAIGGFVQRGCAAENFVVRQQLRLELRRKEFRVQHQKRIGPQELHGERHAVGDDVRRL